MVTVLQGGCEQGEAHCGTRSDAPYPSPLFARDTVMSVDAQANHSQNYAQSGNHSNPSFNQSDYYYQNRSSTPPTNQESAQRTQEPRPYFYGEKNSSAKPIEVKPRSEEPEARSTEQYRSPSPRAEAPREVVRELKAPEGATEQGSPLSSDKENKTEEEREVKPDPPRVSPRPPADREALADRSRSPQEPYPTKYPTYDPRGPLRFPFTYPLERSELRPDLEAETPKPAEATQGRPLASPRENTTQHYTSTTHQHSISAHSPEGSRREKQENLRDSRKQDPEFRGTEADYRFLQQHYPPEYYSQFRRSSTGEGHHSDSDSSEARDLSRPARVSSLSPGGSSRSHTSPGSLPPTPVQGIPLLPGPLGPLGQFPQFFPENANKDLFYCHLCSYVGNSKYHFNAHMNSHFEHQCPQCDYTSRTEGRLKRHIKDFHRPDSEKAPENFSGQTKVMKREPGRPKVFKCRQCEYSSPVKTEFWDHARSHIKEDKVLCCPKCPFVTEYKHHLEYHLRNHFGSKPFKCNKCNYACVNKSMLNSHMKSHTNVYQYRCADCTYATKYCHSLKLHLRKYNHKPATVLNTDGSLPTDGSGDFDLVSKRGPPRGPRGPKEKGDKGEEMSPPHQQFSPAAANMMMTSPQAFAAQAQGMMGGFPWVMSPQGNGLAPPPPLIPVSGMPALSVQVPRTPGSVDGSKASGTSQSDLGSQHSDGDQTPPPRSGSASSHHHHHHNNQQHNKIKSALAENQDLFGAYGIPAESLMAQMGAEEAARFIEYRKQLAEAQMKDLLARSPIKPDPEAMMPPGHMAMWAHHAGAMQAGAANGHGIKREMTEEEEAEHSSPRRNSLGNNGNNGNNGDRYNDALAQDMAATIEAEARQNGECPLDLTKSHEQSQAMDLSPGNKRRYEPAPLTEEEEMRARANSMVSSISCGSLSPTPRKRSRKGKAYKLDALCLKLQERKDDSPAGNESTEEDVSDYTSDKPSSTRSAEGSVNSPSSERPRSNENVDYTAIHNSLRQLNEGVEEEESSSSHGNDVPRREVARSLEFTDTQPEQAEGKLAEKSAPLPNAPNGRYECSHCGIAFRDCILYTMHMGYHGYKDPFKCNMCGHQAANKVEFFLHIARVAHQ